MPVAAMDAVVAFTVVGAAHGAGSRRACSGPPPAGGDTQGDGQLPGLGAVVNADRDVPRQVVLADQTNDRVRLLPGRTQQLGSAPVLELQEATPMPMRLGRWIRSNEVASTALTPSNEVLLAARSGDDPEP